MDSLVVPIAELDFDPFNIQMMDNWKKVMEDIQSKVQVTSCSSLWRGFIRIVSDLLTVISL